MVSADIQEENTYGNMKTLAYVEFIERMMDIVEYTIYLNLKTLNFPSHFSASDVMQPLLFRVRMY